jgi:DUF438 domain-containing protein
MLYIKRIEKHGKTKRPRILWFVYHDRVMIKQCKTYREASILAFGLYP